MPLGLRYEVRDASSVGEVRRGAVEFAAQLGLAPLRVSDVAILVTELAGNLVKHTEGGGELLLSVSFDGHLDVLSLDHGPGIARPGEVLRDGYSTAGTPGTGLGAVTRLASHFDLSSTPGKGTVIWARVDAAHNEAAPARFEVGTLHVPHPHEEVNGDGWAIEAGGGRLRALVVDGLGHGLHARDASRAAEAAFLGARHLTPETALKAVHAALRGTRGAVGGIAELDVHERTVRFAGVGNISAALVNAGERRGLMSHNGTLGQEVRKFADHLAPWPPGALMVLHSDGLGSLWDLARVPGLLQRAAPVIAGVLYRDFGRGRDDATVIVVREAP